MEYLITFLEQKDSITQALLGTSFSWFLTALGASLVFFIKKINTKIMDAMLGSASGIMIAASFWSLLDPALKKAEMMNQNPVLMVGLGFLSGALFLRLIDQLLPHLHLGFPNSKKEGLKTSWRRSTLLTLSITLHNFPEGLAIGVAFGAVSNTLGDTTSLVSAITLAIGISIQNIPEGAAISFPLRREGLSRIKAFWYGQLSGTVEILGGVLGAWAVMSVSYILPFALAFAAGAMIFVVVEELIPESQIHGHSDIATLGTILGFIIMMALDVSLG